MATEPFVAAPPERAPTSPRDRLLGYGFGLLTALCWGTSPILIKKGLEGLPSPTWGVTTGMATATVILGGWMAARRLTGHRVWGAEDGASSRRRVAFLLIAGAVSGFGSLARTVAIDLAPVVVALPLVQTASLFTVVLAPLLLGRHVEHVSGRLLFGAALVVAGSGLVIVGLNR
jgi:drug/metabolite transporter (DMT)-like permease